MLYNFNNSSVKQELGFIYYTVHSPDNMLFLTEKLIFSLFLHKNICSGYSLEAPRRGASNEYP